MLMIGSIRWLTINQLLINNQLLVNSIGHDWLYFKSEQTIATHASLMSLLGKLLEAFQLGFLALRHCSFCKINAIKIHTYEYSYTIITLCLLYFSDFSLFLTLFFLRSSCHIPILCRSFVAQDMPSTVPSAQCPQQPAAHRSKSLGFDPLEFGITMWCKPQRRATPMQLSWHPHMWNLYMMYV